jgi:hypothetical protein
MIQQVEDFEPELKPLGFCYREILANSDVPIPESGIVRQAANRGTR